MAPDLRRVLRELVASPGKTDAFDELRRHPEECLRILSEDAHSFPKGTNSEWLSHLYTILIEAVERRTEMRAASERTGASPSEQDIKIGRSFVDLLLRDLSAEQRNLRKFFEGVTEVDADAQKVLAQHPSVLAAGPAGSDLVRFGLTPATFVDACTTIAALVRRFYRAHKLSKETPVAIVLPLAPAASPEMPLVPRRDLFDEVAWTTHLPHDTCVRLVEWLLEAATVKRQIFDGFCASRSNRRLILVPTPGRYQDVAKLWATTTGELVPS